MCESNPAREKGDEQLTTQPETIVVVMAKKNTTDACGGNCLPEKVRNMWPGICSELREHPEGRDFRTKDDDVVYGVCIDPDALVQEGASELIRLVRELVQLHPASKQVRVVFHGVGRIVSIASDYPEAIRLAMSREFRVA